jgi:hypothetical protein
VDTADPTGKLIGQDLRRFAEEDTEADWRLIAGDTCERKWRRMKLKRLTEDKGWKVSGLTVGRGWTERQRMTVDRGWKVDVTAGRGWGERLTVGSDHWRPTVEAVPRPAGRY